MVKDTPVLSRGPASEPVRRVAMPCPELSRVTRALLIDAGPALPLVPAQPGRRDVVLTQFHMLSAQMLATVRPDGVVAPLIGAGWDLVDLAERLSALRWTGLLFGLTRPLPRRDLVIQEVSGLFPDLRLHLLEIDG